LWAGAGEKIANALAWDVPVNLLLRGEMMRTSAEIRPFMCHEDVVVREFASEYFSLSFDQDPRLMSLVLESCSRYGEQANLLLLHHASGYSQTEISLQLVLDRLSRTRNRNALYHYNEILASAEVHLLKAMLPRIEQTNNILLDTSSKIEVRLRNSECDTETLLHELFSYYYSGTSARCLLAFVLCSC
jgi:hypothetical protein